MSASADQIANAGRARSKELFGDDAEAADAMEQSFITRHSRQKAIDREDMQDNIDTIENAIVPPVSLTAGTRFLRLLFPCYLPPLGIPVLV